MQHAHELDLSTRNKIEELLSKEYLQQSEIDFLRARSRYLSSDEQEFAFYRTIPDAVLDETVEEAPKKRGRKPKVSEPTE